MDKVSKYMDLLIRQINQMETTHWIGIAVVLVVVGVACMHGMNTRM
ncbi:hypothetical protein ETAA8_64880 [Anatilimnocola aggregata]|uniref:Uncharacterized protein n=1 Tax=Anatilimnocola aggregata TaxID=2528021 RepID=A0A517YM90_9BACT|nr:hypothetical protein [Anatilimnocola aggregata]QDU31335.1 hypothetical protein ETAA8_64880 [Anatilimnocola aggregata]